MARKSGKGGWALVGETRIDIRSWSCDEEVDLEDKVLQ